MLKNLRTDEIEAPDSTFILDTDKIKSLNNQVIMKNDEKLTIEDLKHLINDGDIREIKEILEKRKETINELSKKKEQVRNKPFKNLNIIDVVKMTKEEKKEREKEKKREIKEKAKQEKEAKKARQKEEERAKKAKAKAEKDAIKEKEKKDAKKAKEKAKREKEDARKKEKERLEQNKEINKFTKVLKNVNYTNKSLFNIKASVYKRRNDGTGISQELIDCLTEENKNIFIEPLMKNLILRNIWTNFKSDNLHCDNTITTYEFINQNYLKYILDNKTEFKEHLKKTTDKKHEDIERELKTAEDYLSKSKNGMVKVEYKKSKGRLCAVGSLSLQNLMKPIRETICDTRYIDIDIKNAHPVFLKFYCDQCEIKCDLLTEYINNREECLNSILDIARTRGKAKTLLLSILNNGGKKKTSNKFYNSFYDEIQTIINIVITSNQDKYDKFEKIYMSDENNKKKNNPKGSFMSLIMTNIEGFVLDEIYDFFDKPKDAVLIFDGLMIRKQDEKSVKYYTDLMRKCEKKIYNKYNLKIDLVIKPFENKWNFDVGKVGVYVDKKRRNKYIKIHQNPRQLNNKLKTALNITNEESAEFIMAFFEGDIVCADAEGKGVFYFFNPIIGLWKKDKGETLLLSVIYDNIVNYILSSIKDEYDEIEKKKRNWDGGRENCELICYTIERQAENVKKKYELLKQLKGAVFIKNTLSILRTKIYDETFNDKCDLNKNYYAFNNGIVFNLSKNTTEKPSKEEYITLTCGYNYEHPSIEEINEIKNELINKIIPDEDVRLFFMTLLSYGLVGEVMPHFILATNPRGRNGKSVLCDLMLEVVGLYGYTGSADSLIASGNIGGSNPEIANIHKKRFVVFSEPKATNKKFSSSILKNLTEGEINARMNYSNDCKVINQCLFIILANKAPMMDETTPAIEDRTEYIKFRSFFAENNKYDEEAPGMNKKQLKYFYRRNTKYMSKVNLRKLRYAMFYILKEYYYEFFEKENENQGQRRQIGDLRPESVSKDTREYLTGGDDIALLMLEGLGDDKPLIMKGDKNDYITMDEIYDLFISTDYYMDLKDKLKYSKRNLTGCFKSMTQFCDNMKDKIRRRIEGKRHYIRGGGILEGYKLYKPDETEMKVEEKSMRKKKKGNPDEYVKIEQEEDSDEEEQPNNISVVITRDDKHDKGCLFSQ